MVNAELRGDADHAVVLELDAAASAGLLRPRFLLLLVLLRAGSVHVVRGSDALLYLPCQSLRHALQVGRSIAYLR